MSFLVCGSRMLSSSAGLRSDRISSPPPPVQTPDRSMVPSASLGAGRFASAFVGVGPFEPPRRRPSSCACTSAMLSAASVTETQMILLTGTSRTSVTCDFRFLLRCFTRRWRLDALCQTVLIVLDADVLHDLAVRRPQLRGVGDRERPRKRARVLDRHVAAKRREVRPRPPLDEVQLLCVGNAAPVQPEPVVEPDGIDD